MAFLANQSLMQVRTRCHSALFSSLEDVDWQMCLLVILCVAPCFQGVQELWILTLCHWSP